MGLDRHLLKNRLKKQVNKDSYFDLINKLWELHMLRTVGETQNWQPCPHFNEMWDIESECWLRLLYSEDGKYRLQKAYPHAADPKKVSIWRDTEMPDDKNWLVWSKDKDKPYQVVLQDNKLYRRFFTALDIEKADVFDFANLEAPIQTTRERNVFGSAENLPELPKQRPIQFSADFDFGAIQFGIPKYKAERALQIITKYFDFYSAPFIDFHKFQAWGRKNKRLITPLSKELREALKGQRNDFMLAMIGSRNIQYQDSNLHAGNNYHVLQMLHALPELADVLIEHANDPAITKWYQDIASEPLKQMLDQNNTEQLAHFISQLKDLGVDLDKLDIANGGNALQYLATKIDPENDENNQIIATSMKLLINNGVSLFSRISKGVTGSQTLVQLVRKHSELNQLIADIAHHEDAIIQNSVFHAQIPIAKAKKEFDLCFLDNGDLVGYIKGTEGKSQLLKATAPHLNKPGSL